MARKDRNERYSIFDTPSEALKDAIRLEGSRSSAENARAAYARRLNAHYANVAGMLGETSLDAAGYYLRGSDRRIKIELDARFVS